MTMTNIFSFLFHGLIGIGKLILGIYLLSGWFITNALYYLILCGARGHVLYRFKLTKKIEEAAERYAKEYTVYRQSGIFLCVLGITYFLVCLRMYVVGDPVVYEGHIIFLVALIAFIKLGFAIGGTITHRHLKNPIFTTLKLISFVDAIVSIVVTQYTLLIMKQSSQAIYSSSQFGMGCSIVFIFIGIYMFFNKSKAIPVTPQNNETSSAIDPQ